MSSSDGSFGAVGCEGGVDAALCGVAEEVEDAFGFLHLAFGGFRVFLMETVVGGHGVVQFFFRDAICLWKSVDDYLAVQLEGRLT